MSTNVDDIIHSARYSEVVLFGLVCFVSCQVVSLIALDVGVQVTFVIPPNCPVYIFMNSLEFIRNRAIFCLPSHSGPRLGDTQVSVSWLVLFYWSFCVGVDQCQLDAGQGSHCHRGYYFGPPLAGAWCYHDSTRFCLPPGINNGASKLSKVERAS